MLTRCQSYNKRVRMPLTTPAGRPLDTRWCSCYNDAIRWCTKYTTLTIQMLRYSFQGAATHSLGWEGVAASALVCRTLPLTVTT